MRCVPRSISAILLHFLFVLAYISASCSGAEKPQGTRVVSLSPGMTETIYSLGAAEYLVGVTTFCDYPPEAKLKYKIGDFSNPSIERIVSLKPNIVVINLPEHRRIKEQLAAFDIQIYASSPSSLNDVYQDISEIGRLLSKTAEADSLVQDMRAALQPVIIERKTRVYVELAARPLVTIGSHSFLNELITNAGGENIFSDLDKDYPVVAQEKVIARNPEVIIVLHPEDITDRLGWNDVDAVKNNRIYTYLNEDHLLRPGPRLILGYSELKELFSD
jgi:iron complex transport system substrate-binding protein